LWRCVDQRRHEAALRHALHHRLFVLSVLDVSPGERHVDARRPFQLVDLIQRVVVVDAADARHQRARLSGSDVQISMKFNFVCVNISL